MRTVGRQALQVFVVGSVIAVLQSALLPVPGAVPRALPSAALSMLCLCFCWVYGAMLDASGRVYTEPQACTS